LKEEEEKNKT